MKIKKKSSGNVQHWEHNPMYGEDYYDYNQRYGDPYYYNSNLQNQGNNDFDEYYDEYYKDDDDWEHNPRYMNDNISKITNDNEVYGEDEK